jgi:hypothetical protein
MHAGRPSRSSSRTPSGEDRGRWLGLANVSAYPSHPCNGDKFSLRAVVASPVPAPGPRGPGLPGGPALGPAKVGRVPPSRQGATHLANIPVDLTGLKGDDLPFQLLPGPNRLRVEVRVGGALADSEEVTAQFGPSQPANVRFTPRPEGGTDLEWDPRPNTASSARSASRRRLLA